MTALPPPIVPPPVTTGGGQAVIEVEHLVKDFAEHRALDDVSFAVERGSIVGLIGPSGCGKSTLVRSMLGLVAPTSGRVQVFGRDPQTLSTRDRNRLAYMPQLPVLFPNLSVAGNLSFIASLYGVRLRGRRRRLSALLDFVDLGQHRTKRLADCSGGMQRRLTLAATLVHDPELVFLDEPTAGIDPILRDRFWARFRELRNEGRTIVVPTQYVDEASSCDMVAVVSDGRLIAYDTPDGLRATAFDGVPMRLDLPVGWLPGDEMERLGALPFVHRVRRLDDDLLVVLDDTPTAPRLLTDHLAGLGLVPTRLDPIEATFDQVFVELIERDRAAEVPA